MKFDFNKCIKSGVEQAMNECELTIGMTLKECVEKQIPKKAIECKPKSYIWAVCRCGQGLNKDIDRYCPKCGQKLDWSEEE